MPAVGVALAGPAPAPEVVRASLPRPLCLEKKRVLFKKLKGECECVRSPWSTFMIIGAEGAEVAVPAVAVALAGPAHAPEVVRASLPRSLYLEKKSAVC